MCQRHPTTHQRPQINYQYSPQNGSNDVQYKGVMPNSAPWGIIVQVCPFAVRGPLGQYLLLPQCVESTDQFGRVAEWKTFYDAAGNPFQYVWNSTTEYNDFPVKCPNNRHCVASLQDCTQLDQTDPLCNGHGTCMADGSCMCNPGYETFAYTPEYTAQIAYPYDINAPINWVINWNWLDNYGLWCMARDCTSPLQDCSYLGCFPGTLQNNFVDALTACSGVNEGLCGTNTQACLGTQNLVAPLACSGNGIPRQRQYRGGIDYYCACGGAPPGLNPNVFYLLDESNLVPNGWAGTRCNQYTCTETPHYTTPVDLKNLRFSSTQVNGKPYVNTKNQTLPGIWLGACGAPIGPAPEDTAQWANCCPGVAELELCPNVPCQFGSSYKCTGAAQCIPLGGVPLVYPCNHHGTPRADGTCACDANQQTGQGYMADLTRFTYNGCYAPISCPVTLVAPYTVCNQQAACDASKFIAMERVGGYFDQQFGYFALQAGLPNNNQTLLSLLEPNANIVDNFRVQVLNQLALQVLLARADIATCICIYPNDTINSTSLEAMVLPYSPQYAAGVFPYLRPFTQPFALTLTNITFGAVDTAFLTDSNFYVTTEGMTLDLNYLVLNGTTSLVVAFDQPYFISFIQLHAWVQFTGIVNISFPDGSYCPVIALGTTSQFIWAGPAGNAIACTSQYIDFDFTALGSEYLAQCGDPQSTGCITWETQTCLTLGNIVPNLGDYYQGCNVGICCALSISAPTGPFSGLSIAFQVQNTGAGQPIMLVDEMQIFGYATRVQNVTTALKAELFAATGQITRCQDELYVAQAGLEQAQFFDPQDVKSQFNQTYCPDFGGVFATNLDAGQGVDLIAPFCQDPRGCWISARNRNDPPILPPNFFFQQQCFDYGCYTLTPFYAYDLWAVAPENEAQYRTPSPTAFPWTDLYPGVGSGQLTNDNVCQIALYQNTYCGDPMQSQGDSLVILPVEFQAVHEYVSAIAASTVNPYTGTIGSGDYYNLEVVPVGLLGIVSGTELCNGQLYNKFASDHCYDVVPLLQQNLKPGPPAPPTDALYVIAQCVSHQCSQNNAVQLSTIKSVGFSGGCTGQYQLPGDIVNYHSFPGSISSTYHPVSNPGLGYVAPDVCYTFNSEGVAGAVGALMNTPVYKIALNLRAPASPLGTNDDSVMSLATFPEMCTFVQVNFQFPERAPVVYPVPVQLGEDSSTQFLAVWFESYIDSGGAITLFTPCSNSLSCSACPITQTASYQWYQRIFDPFTNFFQTSFDQCLVSQDTTCPLGGSVAQFQPPVSVHMNFTAGNGTFWPWWPLASLLETDPFAFTNLSARITAAQYRTFWDMDHCVGVSQFIVPPSYFTDVCAVQRNFLCQWDIIKFETPAGRQGDVCGPNDRIGGFAQPGVTCFSLFPLADPLQNPYANQVADAYLAGTIPDLVAQNNTDANAIIAFIESNVNTTLAWAFPGFPQCLQTDYSTRNIHPFPAGTQPSLDWVDCNFGAIYSYTCPGRWCDQNTGICRRRCAVSPLYCDPNGPQFEGAPMHVSNIPTYALPLLNTTDFVVTPECGDLILVSSYGVTNAAGPSNVPAGVLVLPTSTSGLVTFRLFNPGGQWFNLVKRFHQFVVNQTNWLSGYAVAASCSNCWLALWIAPASPLQNITSMLLVANLSLMTPGGTTNFLVNFVVPDDGVTYSALGFTFGSLVVGSALSLSDVLATSNSSILACQQNIMQVPSWTESPSSTDSGAPDNVCIFNAGDQAYFNAPTIGQCFCDKNVAGAACDIPALPLPYVPGRPIFTAACGGFSSNQGLALTSNGLLAPVQVNGAFIDQGAYQCKCRDLGMVIRSTFNLDSPFGDVVRAQGWCIG